MGNGEWAMGNGESGDNYPCALKMIADGATGALGVPGPVDGYPAHCRFDVALAVSGKVRHGFGFGAAVDGCDGYSGKRA
jgi:hypothetical protein